MNHEVKKLGAVSFFADIASEMLYPITPIFLTSVLGASMTSLGMIEGVAEAVASLMKSYSGNLSDKLSKRKIFVVTGYFLSAVSKPLIGISSSWVHVLFARGFDRIGKGLRSAPRDALIAESVLPTDRGAAFGLHRSFDTMGAAIGPLLTLALISSETSSLRNIYFWSIVPGLIAVTIAMSVKEPRITANQHNDIPKQGWSSSEFDGTFWKYFFAWTIFCLANSSDVFLLMKAKQAGFSTTHIILLYCSYNLTYAASSPYLGKLSDRIPKKNLMAGGLFIYSAVYLGFAVLSSEWQFWCLFLMYGFYMGATDGVGKALIVDCSPKHLKATALGIFGTTTGLSTVVASTIAGLLWDHLGSVSTFLFASAGAIAAGVLFILLPPARELDKFA